MKLSATLEFTDVVVDGDLTTGTSTSTALAGTITIGGSYLAGGTTTHTEGTQIVPRSSKLSYNHILHLPLTLPTP